MLSIINASGWPMWPLILASMASMALIVERFISLAPSRVAPKKLLDEALLASKSGVPGADVVKHLENSSVFGSVLASGLRALHTNPTLSEADLRSAFEGAGRRAAHQLERFLPALATLASVAPLMGLFGTVVGMIEIFGAQTATGSANPATMAHGIAVALYTTAFGLVIAIPTLLFWRYFRSRVDGYLLQMETGTEDFARHLARFCKS
ncbi:MAG: MotA/TolQ/ExbB proton channel family protein [Brachymonas sp.]|nr:MotA/TolQ/ExbB proton channel family protein [Brachymonas sp.]